MRSSWSSSGWGNNCSGGISKELPKPLEVDLWETVKLSQTLFRNAVLDRKALLKLKKLKEESWVPKWTNTRKTRSMFSELGSVLWFDQLSFFYFKQVNSMNLFLIFYTNSISIFPNWFQKWNRLGWARLDLVQVICILIFLSHKVVIKLFRWTRRVCLWKYCLL